MLRHFESRDGWKMTYLALALLALGACDFSGTGTARQLRVNTSDSVAVGERDLDGARVTTSDATGATVVRTLRAAWDRPGDGWTIAEDARLKIGSPRGDDDSEALWRVESAALGADGRVFVANRGSLEVKAFSSAGRLLWTTGGQGTAPGEFQAFGDLYWCSDSVVVTDYSTRRITRLDVDGGVIETMPWRRLQGGTSPVGFHCDSTGTLARIESQLEMPDRSGPHSATAFLAAGTLSETCAVLGQVGEFDRFRLATGDDMPSVLGGYVFGVAGDHVVHVLFRDEAEILTYGLQGELVRHAEWDVERTRVTSQMLENEAEYRSKILPPYDRVAFIADWLGLDHPDFLPVLDRIVAATNGDLWIKQFRLRMDESDPEVWWIVSANGALRGLIRIPLGFELLWVGDDTVLGLTEDEERNDYLELRALMKPGQ